MAQKTKPAKGRGGKTFVRRDHFAEVTARLVEHLEAGNTIQDLGWDRFVGPVCNPLSGTQYRGINRLLLALSGKPDNRFCTFGQAEKKGWHVRKGEKASPILFYTMRRVATGETDESSGDPIEKQIPILKSYSVFAFSQIEGAPELPVPDLSSRDQWALPDALRERLDGFIKETGARIEEAGDRAFWRPSEDLIRVPPRKAFRSEAEYYATTLHEIGHWSGGVSRLGRDMGEPGDQVAYAKEELRAEIASAFLCSRFGIPSNIPAHAGYLDSYLSILKGDKREIFRAAKDAETIVRYLVDRSPAERAIDAAEQKALNESDLRLDPATPEGSNEVAEPEVFDLNEMFGDDLMQFVAESETLAQSAVPKMRAMA